MDAISFLLIYIFYTWIFFKTNNFHSYFIENVGLHHKLDDNETNITVCQVVQYKKEMNE